MRALTAPAIEAEVDRLRAAEVSRLVALGITPEVAAMGVNRATGNARHAVLGLPDAMADEVLVAKLRYELTRTESWCRNTIERIER